ncbi:MAG: hypothetical protein AAGC55_09755, partial [Myxococcota bacterium]
MLLDRAALHHRVSAELMQLFRSADSLEIHATEQYDNLRGDQLMSALGSFGEAIIFQQSAQPASDGSGSSSTGGSGEVAGAEGRDAVEVHYLSNGVEQQRMLLDRVALHHRVSTELMQLFRSADSLEIHAAEQYDNLRGDQLMEALSSFSEAIIAQQLAQSNNTGSGNGGSGGSGEVDGVEIEYFVNDVLERRLYIDRSTLAGQLTQPLLDFLSGPDPVHVNSHTDYAGVLGDALVRTIEGIPGAILAEQSQDEVATAGDSAAGTDENMAQVRYHEGGTPVELLLVDRSIMAPHIDPTLQSLLAGSAIIDIHDGQSYGGISGHALVQAMLDHSAVVAHESLVGAAADGSAAGVAGAAGAVGTPGQLIDVTYIVNDRPAVQATVDLGMITSDLSGGLLSFLTSGSSLQIHSTNTYDGISGEALFTLLEQNGAVVDGQTLINTPQLSFGDNHSEGKNQGVLEHGSARVSMATIDERFEAVFSGKFDEAAKDALLTDTAEKKGEDHFDAEVMHDRMGSDTDYNMIVLARDFETEGAINITGGNKQHPGQSGDPVTDFFLEFPLMNPKGVKYVDFGPPLLENTPWLTGVNGLSLIGDDMPKPVTPFALVGKSGDGYKRIVIFNPDGAVRAESLIGHEMNISGINPYWTEGSGEDQIRTEHYQDPIVHKGFGPFLGFAISALGLVATAGAISPVIPAILSTVSSAIQGDVLGTVTGALSAVAPALSPGAQNAISLTNRAIGTGRAIASGDPISIVSNIGGNIGNLTGNPVLGGAFNALPTISSLAQGGDFLSIATGLVGLADTGLGVANQLEKKEQQKRAWEAKKAAGARNKGFGNAGNNSDTLGGPAGFTQSPTLDALASDRGFSPEQEASWDELFLAQNSGSQFPGDGPEQFGSIASPALDNLVAEPFSASQDAAWLDAISQQQGGGQPASAAPGDIASFTSPEFDSDRLITGDSAQAEGFVP